MTDADYINIFSEFFEEHLPRLTERERRRMAASLLGLCREEGFLNESDDLDLGSEEDEY